MGNWLSTSVWLRGSTTKPMKSEAVVVQEGLDLRDRQPVLLHMEATAVAAAAHVVEIRRLPEPADIGALAFGNKLLTEAADVVGARSIAALGDQATHR